MSLRVRVVVASAVLPVALAIGIGAATASCGPSFQAVYEGDVRFEHCYAVDESATTGMKEKAECWREWMKNYTYGQTRDRVEYAAARHYALVVAPNAPTDEAMMEAAPGGGIRRKVISAPMPTSVYAAPPNTMPEPEKVDAGASNKDAIKAPLAPKARAPASDCAEECTQAWHVCNESCSGSTCDGCDKTYRVCMGRCFKDDARKKPAPPKPAPPKPTASN